MKNETYRRVARDAIQFVAAGGLTYAVHDLDGNIPAAYLPFVLTGAKLAATWAMNWCEEHRVIPPVFKTDPLAQALAEASVEIQKRNGTYIVPANKPGP